MKYMNKKILFTDLDGTLLNSQKTISENTYRNILNMLEQGHKFVLASGRPLNSILDVKEKLHLPDRGVYVTAFNGALLYDCERKTVLHEERVALPEAQTLFDTAVSLGIHIHTYDEQGHIISCAADAELAYYRKAVIGTPLISTNLSVSLEKGPFKLLTIHLVKGEADKESPKLLSFKNEIQNSPLGEAFSCAFSNPYYLEFFHKNAGKGNGLMKLCELLQIPVSDSIAAGDAENDVSMLTAAGTGIAMLNGDANIKAAADFVTTCDCNHDGMVEIMQRYVLS